MTTKYMDEVKHIGGAALLTSVLKEMSENFFIVARDPDMIIVGDETHNVEFSRKTNGVTGRFFFSGETKLQRK